MDFDAGTVTCPVDGTFRTDDEDRCGHAREFLSLRAQGIDWRVIPGRPVAEVRRG
jgi:hypothetical protein